MFNVIRKAFHRPGSKAWLLDNNRRPQPMRSLLVEDVSGSVAQADKTTAVYTIKQGEVTRGTVSGGIPLDGVVPLAGTGSNGADTVRFARETIARCAPWVTTYIVPRLTCAVSSHTYAGELVQMPPSAPRGLSYFDGGVSAIVVAYGYGYQSSLRYLHHEIWHSIENTLSEAGNKKLANALSPYGYTAGADGYRQAASERLARAYAEYAVQCDELCERGVPLPITVNVPLAIVYRAFSEVYSGSYARELRELNLI